MKKGNRMIRSWKRIVVWLAVSGLLCAHSMAADFFGKPFAWKTGMYSSVEGETVTVSVPEGKGNDRHAVTSAIDLRPVYDSNLVFRIKVKAENVSKPPEKWNGVKFMLSYRTAEGNTVYKHPTQLWGTFEKEIFFASDIPEGATEGVFYLGLQNSSGKVTFYLNTLQIRRSDREFMKKVNTDWVAEYSDSVRNRPALRGVMLGNNLKESDYRDLAAYGANLGRAQLIRNWGKINTDLDLEDYDRWLNGRLDYLEKEFEWAEKYGIKLIIDLHTPSGGRNELREHRLHAEKKYFDHFIDVWKRIVTRFKGKKALWGYNLINEPNQIRGQKYDYWNIQRIAAEEIRKLDPETPIYVESNGWSAPATFRYFSPIKLKNIIYQFHMYQPGVYTHQMLDGNFGEKGAKKLLTYPGMIDGKFWNKEELRKSMASVREFQLKHKAKIFCGEFSAIIWAPGAEQYLRDCIDLFEEYGWEWTYHAFREWNGWSMEHRADSASGKVVPSADNGRKQALLSGFSKNGKK